MDTEFEPPFVHNQQGDRSASVIQIDMGKALWAVTLCGVFAALGVGISVHAAYVSQQSAMETRLLQEKVNKYDARLIAHQESAHAKQ